MIKTLSGEFQCTENQKKIMDYGFKIIAKTGISKITLKKIAESMGITEPAIYRHFKNKHDFIRHLYICVYSKLFKAICEIKLKNNLHSSKVEEYKDYILDFNKKNNDIIIILLSNSITSKNAELLEIMKEILKLIYNSFKDITYKKKLSSLKKNSKKSYSDDIAEKYYSYLITAIINQPFKLFF